jgi:hypothetical protein
MQEVPWFISFAFSYPTPCTPEELLKVLRRLAADWPGWEHFPWRVTRNIHLFLGRPPVNFHHLMLQRCLTSYAAHLVLTLEFESREDVLAVMIRERFEILGVLRVLLVDALRYEMRFSRRTYIPDCTGSEEGHEHVAPEELAKRRETFRECIEGAAREYRKILDLASQTPSMDEWILGRPLRAWARGGDLPEPVTLTVQMEETPAGRVVRPQQVEVARIVAAGKRVPRLLVTRAREEGGEGEGMRVGVCGGEGKVNSERSTVSSGSEPREGKRVGECGAPRGGTATEPEGGKLRTVRAEAGRERAVVKHPGDRQAIRAAVGRLMAPPNNLSQTEACRQVAETAVQGRAGKNTLSMSYRLPPDEATPSVIRRTYLADW